MCIAIKAQDYGLNLEHYTSAPLNSASYLLFDTQGNTRVLNRVRNDVGLV